MSMRQLLDALSDSAEAEAAISVAQFPRLNVAEVARLRARQTDFAIADSQKTLSAAREVAAVMPLSDVPFAIAGLSLRGEDKARSDRLLQTALKRNPRNQIARLWLADAAARAGNYSEAIAEIDALFRLDPERRKIYAEAIASLARDPKARGPIVGALSNKPIWAADVARLLSAEYPRTSFARAVLRYAPDAQGQYLTKLVSDGRFDEAFVAWREFMPVELSSVEWPYDPKFENLPGAAPFNWKLSGEAEFEKNNGLYITFMGRRSENVATQVMLLGPGGYQFSAQMRGEMRPRGGHFRWTIECLANGRKILERDVETLTDELRPVDGAFEVPFSDCPAQRLALRAISGELPLWARSVTRQVSITQTRGAAAPLPASAELSTTGQSAAVRKEAKGAL